MTTLAGNSDRREQIDGLRVIAMTGVFYVHYWNQRPSLEFVRVSLFFVISGFLITLILLSAKDSHKDINVINFYIRRLLRLLPALLFMLFVAAAFNMDGIRSSIVWHALQSSNLYFTLNESWAPWVTAHLWSLNVVEQFYIFAPIGIIFLTRRTIFVVCCVVLVLSILMRIHFEQDGVAPWSRLIFAFDPLAAGAILALVKDNVDVREILTSRLNNVASIAIIFSPLAVGVDFGRSETYRILIIYALSSIVLSSYIGYRGAFALMLANPITRFLSRVSYAAYVYHLAIWWLVAEHFPALYVTGPITFIVMSAITVIAATISWHLAERHFDGLKALFPVTRPLRGPLAQQASALPESVAVKG